MKLSIQMNYINNLSLNFFLYKIYNIYLPILSNKNLEILLEIDLYIDIA